MNYIVQQGDSPALIAKKLTGTPALASQLIAANPRLPRMVSGGLVTFKSLAVGQALQLPPSWGRYAGGALRGAFGVGDANSVGVEFAAIQAQAAAAPTADADGSYHGAVTAYQTAGQVAVTAGGLGPDIDSTYGISVTGSNTQAAFGTNTALQATSNGDATSATPATSADATVAKNYLQAMVNDYQAAITAGKAAQGGGGGGGGGGTGGYSAATIAAAQAVTNLGSFLCDLGGSKTGNGTVLAFQQAYNATPGVPSLTTDGKYGPNTQSACANVLVYGGGAVAPAACTSYKNAPGTAPGGCPAGQATDVDTGACVPICSDGSAPVNGICNPTAQPSTNPVVAAASNGPLIAGILLVGLGAGAVAYAVRKHPKVHHRRR